MHPNIQKKIIRGYIDNCFLEMEQFILQLSAGLTAFLTNYLMNISLPIVRELVG